MGYFKVTNGAPNWVDDSNKIETVTDDRTLAAEDSGLNLHIGTDAKTFTLPAIATVGAGVEYTFTNIGADGNNIITISPAAADAIHGTITLAASVVELSGVDDKDLINTKATATTGNSVKLISGTADWFVVSSTGIWASE